jgi:hypothetical protein
LTGLTAPILAGTHNFAFPTPACFLLSPATSIAPGRGGFLLHRRPVGHHADGRDIDPFARDLDGRDLGHWLATSRDAHAVAGSGALDQLAKVRLGIDKISLTI